MTDISSLAGPGHRRQQGSGQQALDQQISRRRERLEAARAYAGSDRKSVSSNG